MQDVIEISSDDDDPAPPPKKKSKSMSRTPSGLVAKKEESAASDEDVKTPFSSQEKGKGKATPKKTGKSKALDKPSEATYATWKKGANDVESSAKMSSMIEMVQEWDESGDKCIVFSQCEQSFPLFFFQSSRVSDEIHRDVGAGHYRDALWTTRDSHDEV